MTSAWRRWVDLLHHVTDWYLDALKAANRTLVDYHHRLPIPINRCC